jgi:NAD(P)-dependent dehydrogenase (short-subunit alcohol dehydrogenase family)
VRQSIALAHAKANARGIVLITQSASSGKETEVAVKAEYPSVEVLTLTADITDESAISETFKTIEQTLGVPHILVNNAGVFSSVESIDKADPKVWWKDFEINVRGTYLFTAAYLRHVSGNNTVQPTIVNLISSIGLTPPGLSSYFMSKLAVAKFTEFIAAEQPSIVAYSLSPGIVPTSMTLDSFKPFAKDTRKSHIHQL